MNLKFYLIILFLFPAISFCCSCNFELEYSESLEHEIKESECIFLADVVEIDTSTSTFKFIIIEEFGVIEAGHSMIGNYNRYCGPIVDEPGLWLLYGNTNIDGQFSINSCGLTRSLNNPNSNIISKIPPPNDPNYSDQINSKRLLEFERKEHKKAVKQFYKEIAILRNRKMLI